jgi:hypothetical protein
MWATATEASGWEASLVHRRNEISAGSGVMEEKNARPHKNADPSAPNGANSTKSPRFTLRQTRVMHALFRADDWLSREAIDRIACASNGPQIILELRRKVTGRDGIDMQQVDSKDADGKTCKPGRYRLTGQGRERIREAIARQGGAA